MDLDVKLEPVDLNEQSESDVEFEEDEENPEAPGPSTYSIHSFLELSTHDEEDNKQVEAMFGPQAAPCCNTKCNTKIPKDLAQQYRSEFIEMSKYDQDLVVLSHLEANKQDVRLMAAYPKRRNRTERAKTRCDMKYVFRGLPICKNMYLFIHNIGRARFKNLSSHIDRAGFTPRKHGLLGKKPNRSKIISEDVKQHVVTFIKNYAEANATSEPGSFRNFDTWELPSSVTKSSVYNLYMASVDDAYKVGNRSFLDLWLTHVPYITTMKPPSNFCNHCRNNNVSVNKRKKGKLKSQKRNLNDA